MARQTGLEEDVVRSREDDPPGVTSRATVAEVESALVLHYRRLVRLAYVVLPTNGDRHRRVLAAHAVVQNVLPLGPSRSGLGSRGLRRRTTVQGAHVPMPRGPVTTEVDGIPADSVYVEVRQSVLAAALRGAPRLPLLLPRTWGMRLLTHGGGSEELALDRALAGLSSESRAACALLTLESLETQDAEQLLTAAGAVGAGEALRTARRLLADHPRQALWSSEFDPCTVDTRPTDLLLRRTRLRWTTAGLVGLLVVTAVTSSALSGGSGDTHAAATAVPGAGNGPLMTVADLVRVPADAWRSTARIDFTAWPARGKSVGDQGLLAEALNAWETPRGTPPVHADPGAATIPPVGPPHLLWAGSVDGASVVLLDDTTRIARYTRPDHPTGMDPIRLDLTRADDSDVTSAGAVLLRSSSAGDRFLIAPWVDAVDLRDLKTPDTLAHALSVTDGVTALVPLTPATGCASWPTLQLRSSTAIAEHHAFLLTNVGDVTATHLTYTPPPQRGVLAQPPREATGPDALQAWARLACSLSGLRGRDVKQVNAWQFAQQTLPENQGAAAWVCTRADRWDGSGSAITSFLPPNPVGAPAVTTATQPAGRACSRFEQYIVASTQWRAPSGRQYLLAAGSRHVTRISTSTGIAASATDTVTPDHTLALLSSNHSLSAVSALLDTGQVIHPLTG